MCSGIYTHIQSTRLPEPGEKRMLNVIKAARIQPSISFSSPLRTRIVPGVSRVRYRQAAAGTNQPEKIDKMEHTQEPNAKTGNLMSHSFGEGYASRADEDGFGGTTCGGDQSISNIESDRMINESHPGYDKSQGSEVKQKEEARNQPTAS